MKNVFESIVKIANIGFYNKKDSYVVTRERVQHVVRRRHYRRRTPKLLSGGQQMLPSIAQLN